MSAEMVQQMTRKIYDSLYTTKCNFHIRTYTPLSVDATLAGIGHCTCSDWATLTFSSWNLNIFWTRVKTDVWHYIKHSSPSTCNRLRLSFNMSLNSTWTGHPRKPAFIVVTSGFEARFVWIYRVSRFDADRTTHNSPRPATNTATDRNMQRPEACRHERLRRGLKLSTAAAAGLHTPPQSHRPYVDFIGLWLFRQLWGCGWQPAGCVCRPRPAGPASAL